MPKVGVGIAVCNKARYYGINHVVAERSDANKCAVWHLALRMLISIYNMYVLGPGGAPGRHSGNEYAAKHA